MYGRLSVLLFTLIVATTAFAREVFLSITGKVGSFSTDARILNPSFTKDITVNAQYLPQGNQDNTGATVVPLVIPKRSMRVFDDVVQSMFGGGAPLGGIRLVSDDDFVAEQRIFQNARELPQAGTLGQFVPGLEPSAAKLKGVVIGLRSGETNIGPFRTNWGGLNPNTAVANVTLKLYDKNNAVVATKTRQLQPFAIQTPQNIVDLFAPESATANLTDAWISYQSDVPVFIYCSVLDNGSVDPTFIPASNDSGVAPTPPPPQEITAHFSAINFSYAVNFSRQPGEGEQVRFIIRADEGTHGFRLFSPSGQILIDLPLVGGTAIERVITLPSTGTYAFLCTRDLCGEGHTSMNGSFVIGSPTGPRDDY